MMESGKHERSQVSAGNGKSGDLASLIEALASDDGKKRQGARHALLDRGEAAVPLLTEALTSSQTIVRWEAAKTLTELHSRAAVPSLIAALEDESWDIRWLAAEALIGIGRDSIRPLLEALTKDGPSVPLREGAHHVLREIGGGRFSEVTAPVLETLVHYDDGSAVPTAAEEALERLRRHAA